MQATQDPRIDGHICHVTRIIGSTEWVCVKAPHAEIYYRRKTHGGHYRHDPIFSNNPQADAHYFVNRWPNREKD